MNETILEIISIATTAAINNGLLVVQDSDDMMAAIDDFYDVIKEDINIMVKLNLSGFYVLLSMVTSDFKGIYDNIDSFINSELYKKMISDIYYYYFA